MNDKRSYGGCFWAWLENEYPRAYNVVWGAEISISIIAIIVFVTLILTR